jgi:hypothetical protein
VSELVHVLPINDARPHRESVDCECRPRVEGRVCIHNSWDGREIAERAIDAVTDN